METAITHVIFDLDGVLLETEPHYLRASTEVCARHGYTFTLTHKARMLGLPEPDAAAWLVAELGLPLSPEEFLRERAPILEGLFTGTPPMPGALELVTSLSTSGVPCAIASSSSRRTFNLKMSQHQDWLERFTAVVLADDPEVSAGKPAPDLFLVAARRLGAVPEQCLVIEDAPSGIVAARAAGMAVVALPDPAIDPSLFPPADEVLAALSDFRPQRWGLPPFTT